MIKKIKSFLAEDVYFYTLLVVLVGVAAYGLGRQSALQSTNQAATVYRTTEPVLEIPDTPNPTDQVVVASKNGSRYYLPSCSGASRITEANLVTFPSAQAAEDAGYTAAANCPGLE